VELCSLPPILYIVNVNETWVAGCELFAYVQQPINANGSYFRVIHELIGRRVEKQLSITVTWALKEPCSLQVNDMQPVIATHQRESNLSRGDEEGD